MQQAKSDLHRVWKGQEAWVRYGMESKDKTTVAYEIVLQNQNPWNSLKMRTWALRPASTIVTNLDYKKGNR